ncbi:mannosyl-3-phosphoglycerate phosphatase-related protein [Erwiniaceae bacterium BAC15a-03b]|uniref:Mannosyl-3-phosphoglycerate phosphatase-related protein n=1 Tax=Winslowiella arboricola TaxID=2978220 RepID=A0A9J6PTZ2_9GAMM|nr:mannosyl-3-phosphoglycerate phosphatase-related protein [Winslowiella arboricola]MCU5773263.1 mannosyl-3-phosphoglycerate phosphatase-related protein [Winslowiella arboricola]MCU5779149.1 mannosyl-3-phosphoglycerate phosphatase-related protein [Winslowiella arboricola]
MPGLHDSLMIVTDLDGSLLDHHSYSWQPAQPWLDKILQHQIPLVICSSKTASEIIPLQQQLGLSGAPFIAENGALVQLDHVDGDNLRHHAGKDYSEICHCLRRLRQQYQFRFSGFADFTDQEVADITGLTVRNAALARRREASESLVWRDSEQQFAAFSRALEQEGLSLTQGGRFWHVMASGSGKGAALAWLLQAYKQDKRFSQHNFITIGLGDGPNDAPMLDSVDYAVVIKGHSKTPVTLTRQDQQNIYHTSAYGPEGWQEGLQHFIAQD